MKKAINIHDEDLTNAEVALKRAAKRAKIIAKNTKTPLIYYENGSIVKKYFAKSRVKKAS